MAIIRSKIARQLLAEGGAPRKGYFDAGRVDDPNSVASGLSAAATDLNTGSSTFSGFGGGGDGDNITFKSPPALGAGENPVITYDTGPGRATRNLMKFGAFATGNLPFFFGANTAINNELAREQMLANARLSGSFMLPNQLPMRMTRNNTNRFNNEDDNDNIVLPILPKIPKLPSDIEPEQSDMAEFIAGIRGANPTAFDISERFRLAEGGEPRQNYGLGKLVKKVTGAVKKVAKSDLGKAALIGAAAFGIPGMGASGGLGGGIFGRASFGGFAPGVFNLGGIGNLFAAGALNPAAQKAIGTKTGIGAVEAIVGASLLGGLLTSKEPEQDINALSQRISDQTGIDVAKIRGEVQQAYQNKDTSTLAQKYPFLVNQEYSASFATGGRIGFKDGTKEKSVKEVEEQKFMSPEEYFQGKRKFNKKKMLEDMENEYKEYLDRQKYGPRNEAAIGGDIEDTPKKEGIMMASAILGDESDDIAQQLFGKPVKELTPDEFKELMDYLDDLQKSFRAEGGRIGAQEGGMMNLGGNEMDLRGGGFVPIGAREKADDVPARLSKNEFVFTADAVRAAGGGSVDRGADLMYKTMKQLENKVV